MITESVGQANKREGLSFKALPRRMKGSDAAGQFQSLRFIIEG